MRLAVAAVLLLVLPFLFAVHPQQADYPSHLARYHIMLDRGQSAFLARYYDFEWVWSGNLGVDLLMWPLGRLLGVDQAAWLIAAALPLLVGLAILVVEWTLRQRIGIGALLALTTVWSPAMLMGLANFTLSIALALFAFAGWVRLNGWRWRAALFVPLGVIVFLCHSAGWGVLGVLVFGHEWSRRKKLASLVAPWPLFLPFALLAAAPGVAGSFHYGKDVASYKTGIWVKALADRVPVLDMLSVGVLVGGIALALMRRRIDGRLSWAALILALLALAMPRHFGGGDLADLRLVPVALMLGCLAIDARVARRVLWLACVLLLVRLGVTTMSWKADSERLEAALDALDHVPQGARVAAAVAYDRGRWSSDAFAHAPSYATVYRDALVNTHFALKGVHMLRVREGGENFSDPSQQVAARPGESIDLSCHPPAKGADFLWYFGDNPVARLPRGAELIHHSPGSMLVRLAKPSRSS